jgi:hypothetical protein
VREVERSVSDERVVRGISISEACARLPDAMVKFDYQCRHLHGAPNLRFTMRRLGGRVDGAEYLRAAGNLTSSSCRSARYDLVTGCWIRYSHGVKSHPRRDIGEDMPGPYALEWVDESWTLRFFDDMAD